MATRVVNGNTHSEDGWPLVDQGSCTWVTVPGVAVTLQIQNGQPLILLRAWAADWNAYLEPLRDADSACWTESNRVLGQPGQNNGSNHLGGTAIDLNWDSHPFRNRGSFNTDQMRVMEEMEDFYEGTVFWAGRWDNPVDEMHSQCGYNTFNNPRIEDFIRRKIRADGYSTYKRGNVPVPPALSRTDRYALVIISVGRELGITPRGICIALCVGLVETTDLKIYANSNDPPSLAFYHDAVGSDHMSVGVFQQQPPWGPLADRMTVSGSARIFFTCDVGPGVRGLLNIRDSNGNRYDYRDESHSPGFYCQKVQGSAFPDRYDARWNDAVALYNRLAGAAPPPAPTGDEDMAAVPQDEWNEIRDKTRALFQMFYEKKPSTSRYGDPEIVWDIGQLIRNMDGFGFNLEAEHNAALGQQWAIDQIGKKAAAGDALAQAFLDRLNAPEAPAPAPASVVVQAPAPLPPPPVYVPPAPLPMALPQLPAHEPGPSTNGVAKSPGELLGNAYDSLVALKLSDVITDDERAPLAAIVGVLKSKMEHKAYQAEK